jgi:hypothetical protein
MEDIKHLGETISAINKEIDILTHRKNVIQSKAIDIIQNMEQCPYKIGTITPCKNEKFHGEICKIIRIKPSYYDGWQIKIVARLFSNDGAEWETTDWTHKTDYQLNEFVHQLNKII